MAIPSYFIYTNRAIVVPTQKALPEEVFFRRLHPRELSRLGYPNLVEA